MSTHKRERACVRCRTRKERLDEVEKLIAKIDNYEWELLGGIGANTSNIVQRLRKVLSNATLRVNP